MIGGTRSRRQVCDPSGLAKCDRPQVLTAERSEVTPPVEHQANADRVHGIQVHGRRARWIDHALAARYVYAAEELQHQLGGLARIECPIRPVLENREVEICLLYTSPSPRDS